MTEEAPVQLLPIDIHYSKLLDWLLSRRHCQQTWPSNSLVIREKINTAIQDMPPVEDIANLLKGTYVNYFHCKQIVELLKKTDDGSKNFLGQYSSKRMKDWIEIINLYEKEGIYLAESAQMLIRNVNYEIPAIKKQITKCQQLKQDSIRKEGEYGSLASEFREKYHNACKQMGIEGKKVKTELMSLVKDMPSTFERITKNAKGLQNALDYYTSFVEFTVGKKEFSEQCCPMLRYIIQHGDTTLYEHRTGIVPESVVPPQLDLIIDDEEDLTEEGGDTGEIDWGDLGGGDEIDFGDDEIAIEVSAEGSTIDWGDEGISVSEETEQDSHVAKGTDALTLLDNPETRNLFVDDLYELESFLNQRLAELHADHHILASNQFQSAPASIQLSEDNVSSMLSAVHDVIQQLTSERMRELCMIRSSPRYVERLASKIKDFITKSEKMAASKRLMVQRQGEAMEEQKSLEPKLDVLRQKTKELQKQIAAEISKKYQDRTVNIMGEINTV